MVNYFIELKTVGLILPDRRSVTTPQIFSHGIIYFYEISNYYEGDSLYENLNLINEIRAQFYPDAIKK